METKTVFNAAGPLAVTENLQTTKAQVLFLYAMASAAADRPVILNVEEGPLPFTGIDELCVPYGAARDWLGRMLDANLVCRSLIDLHEGEHLRDYIRRLSVECSENGLTEFCVDDNTLSLTANGVTTLEQYGRALDTELLVIERMILKIVNERYSHCGIGVEELLRHVPTLNPRELKGQFVLVDRDLMAATYRRTDGILLVNVFGVGTFIIEKLCAINVPLLATLADEGHLQRDPEDTLSEYHDRFQALSKEYQRQHGIPDDDEEEDTAVPTDAPMANLAAALGKMLGSRVGLSRIDIPAGGGKADVVDLNDKVQDAEVVLDAEKKPVS